MYFKINIRPADLVAPGFHFVALVHHLITINSTQEILRTADVTADHRVLHMVNFSHLFFTSWNMIFQTIYFTLALIYDIVKLSWNQPHIVEKLKMYKGYFFTTVIFPCAIFVSALFWSVYNIDRELVYSQVLDNYIPKWMNHCVHTNISIFLILEVIIASQKLPSYRAAFLGLTIITAVYDSTIFLTYFSYGRWIYALFQILSWTERVFLLICNYGATLLFMKLGMLVQDYKNQMTQQSKTTKCS